MPALDERLSLWGLTVEEMGVNSENSVLDLSQRG
jgi:hypothetical protein